MGLPGQCQLVGDLGFPGQFTMMFGAQDLIEEVARCVGSPKHRVDCSRLAAGMHAFLLHKTLAVLSTRCMSSNLPALRGFVLHAKCWLAAERLRHQL